MPLRGLRLIFRCLILVGIFMIGYGLAGPPSQAAAFSSAVMEDLGIDSNPEMFSTLCSRYQDAQSGRGFGLTLLGFLVTIPSVIGLWSIPYEWNVDGGPAHD
jgi:hypothetical protein